MPDIARGSREPSSECPNQPRQDVNVHGDPLPASHQKAARPSCYLLLRPGLSEELDYFGMAASLGTSQRRAVTGSFDLWIGALRK